MFTNLNSGYGNPWALQSKEMSVKLLWKYVVLFPSFPNFGTDPLIGSKNVKAVNDLAT
jgi:hypothetical protein